MSTHRSPRTLSMAALPVSPEVPIATDRTNYEDDKAILRQLA